MPRSYPTQVQASKFSPLPLLVFQIEEGMATPNPGPLFLNNTSARKVGQTKNTKTQSLHRNISPRISVEETDAALFAPPADSSDEDLAHHGDEKRSMDGKSQGSQEASSHPESERATEQVVLLDEAVIKPSRSKAYAAQRSSQRRDSSPVEDDDMSFLSQPLRKKPRPNGSTYDRKDTQNTRNIHTASKVSHSPEGFQEIKRGRHGFKMPPATVPKRQEPSRHDASQKRAPKFNKPAELGPSRRPSQDPQHSTLNDKQPTFNFPKRLTPKKGSPKPLKPKATYQSNGTSSIATRSSQSNRKPLASADANATPPETQIQNAITTSANLLGLNDAENDTVSSMGPGTSVEIRKTSGLEITDLHSDQQQLQDMSGTLTASLSTVDPPSNSSLDQMSISSGLSTPPDSPSKARCPLCKGLVEKLFLEGNAGGKRMTVRQQAEFCKAHKIKTAHEEWNEKGLPSIDWPTFNHRLKTYHPRIEHLLRGDKASFYRNAFEDTVRSGKNRTLRQALLQGGTVEGLSPGYYGSRGAKIMVDNIIARFSSTLRRLGGSDKLISASGVSGYVQAVLAPELAVMLVMDDMKTDQEGAREILRDSIDIGNLLNEEEDEVVQRIDDAKEDIDLVEVE